MSNNTYNIKPFYGEYLSVENTHVYNLHNSELYSAYPMADSLNTAIERSLNKQGTDKRTKTLGSAKPGSGHDCFLKGITVSMSINFSLKAWAEAQRYHWFDFISSMSTMHCVSKFNIEDMCNKHVWQETIDKLRKLAAEYNGEQDQERKRELFLELVYNLPTGLRLPAGMTTNYLQLKTMYNQREHHKLPEWREFCRWCESLPKFKELIGRE